ncbi:MULTISPECIES: nicotinamide riboside transporter PnuC [Pseudoalteromonas]|jgi:nicotinamide mononucleotide transporter|uniref:Nicotinamide riboside transporter PnuC n=2 Tax=Pseudoalteromonas TaxID=53246 RepID=A0AAD0S1H1_9GAMM|nr:MULTISPECIES: nicotinamide riboside transporter PnuC [Pseudoalteromonas]AXV66350.1 nicotinamide riboside transporter PnuC [Pseudoalteromonas donghaensis]EWH04986.1 nicotinamide mononucleotide transporter [Pseudoalteromonas lipolytica SCSIO 04301]MAE01105.1 nicotinamide riboside transporter PnuC [Pseudoalteromonas sp.]MBE0349763.1 nicotinamide mononucleotide transporter [Pseudoalteromonas lipolytica LMEB 39]QMW14093.1 nicotinamide mononucleotide transporter [Pseudoalteromonas sp. MT33b]|tara:strand:- start:1162 stop:1785 length:624 start_codon:yes stop_codon:yes gene_type:complete
MEFLTETFSGFTAMSHWEYIAVALSMAYLLLAIKESLWCWPAAFASTFIYTVMYWNGALLMESLLNLYYMYMAVYGWVIWRRGLNHKDRLPIVSWSLKKHVVILFTTSLASVVIGFIMTNYTHADFAYLDSFTTCFAVVTTYLVAKKVLENWLYWIVIDAASMYLYFEKGYYPTLVLFVFYTIMAAWGFKTWYEEYEQHQAKPLAQL